MSEENISSEKIFNAYLFTLEMGYDRKIPLKQYLPITNEERELEKEKFITKLESLSTSQSTIFKNTKSKERDIDFISNQINYYLSDKVFVFFHLRKLSIEDIGNIFKDLDPKIEELILIHAYKFSPAAKKKLKEIKIKNITTFLLDDIQSNNSKNINYPNNVEVLSPAERKRFIESIKSTSKKDVKQILPKIPPNDFMAKYMGANKNDIIQIISKSLCKFDEMTIEFRIVSK